MTNRFLISAAVAALIAGTGFANAQGTGMNRDEVQSGGAATQQTAPSRPAVPVNRDSGMKGAESTKGSESKDMKASNPTTRCRASKSAQDTKSPQGEKSKHELRDNDGRCAAKDMKAEGRDSKTGSSMNAESRDSKTGTVNAQTKARRMPRSQTTTGNAATTATAAPPAEKRTQIVSAIKSEKIEEATNVNFNISVGATRAAPRFASTRFRAGSSRSIRSGAAMR